MLCLDSARHVQASRPEGPEEVVRQCYLPQPLEGQQYCVPPPSDGRPFPLQSAHLQPINEYGLTNEGLAGCFYKVRDTLHQCASLLLNRETRRYFERVFLQNEVNVHYDTMYLNPFQVLGLPDMDAAPAEIIASLTA